MRKSVQSDTGTGDTFEDVVTWRMARRSFLKDALLTVPLVIAGPRAVGYHLAEATPW